MSDDITYPGMVPAEERMLYSTFSRNFTAFKKGDLPRKITSLTEMQLPNNSVLHTVDHLLRQDVPSILPDITNPLLTNEDFMVYMHHVVSIPDAEHPLFPVTDKYRFIPARFNPEIQKFNQTSKVTRRMSSLTGTLQRPSVLSVFNYNPILKTYLHGRLVAMRTFDILFRTILSNLVEHPDKYHHIQIPMSLDIYTKIQLERAFKKMDITTVRIHNDPSYYFLIHLLGFLADAPTSLFMKLPQATLDATSVILTCEGTDDSIIYNLGNLKAMANAPNFHLIVLRHINVLKMKTAAILRDADAELSDDDLDQLSEVNARGDDDDKKQVDVTTSDGSDTTDTKTPPPDLGDEVRYTPSDLDDQETPDDIRKEQTTHRDHLATRVKEIVKDSPIPLSEVQKDRVLSATDRYEEIELGGKTLASLIDAPNETEVSRNSLDFLEKSLPDESMAHSTIIDYDNLYITQQLDRDIAAVLTSFTSNGMIVQDIKEEDEVNEFNRLRHYTVTFADTQGKRHTIRFKLPIVDKEGTLLLNGIRSRMVKQQVNLPICKVSKSRVNLSSNFNKTLVERTTTMAHQYGVHMSRYLGALQRAGLIKVEFGKAVTSDKLPYDYSSVAEKYAFLKVRDYNFTFDYNERFEHFVGNVAGLEAAVAGMSRHLTEREVKLISMKETEKHFGIYCGRRGKEAMFYGHDNTIRVIKIEFSGGKVNYATTDEFTLRGLLSKLFRDEVVLPKLPAEWTELKIQDQNFPIAFILGYRFGITGLLKMLKHPYRFVPQGSRVALGVDELTIPFADGNLVISRYPLETSLVLAGLSKYKTREYMFAHFDLPDTYFTLLSENRLSTNYLKGINAFFDLFVDPITRDILIRMGEPTSVRGLLLRATQMLATREAIPASSMANHRIRGYERLPDILFNELSREMHRFNAQTNPKKSFSINPNEVLMSIMKDPTVQPVEELNPIHDIKLKTTVTYAGSGGRTAQSFVINDRKFPEDGTGVLSECTPDSGKVAINAYTSMDPVITNIRGMFDVANVDVNDLEPSNILSATSLLMPGATQDDRYTTLY